MAQTNLLSVTSPSASFQGKSVYDDSEDENEHSSDDEQVSGDGAHHEHNNRAALVTDGGETGGTESKPAQGSQTEIGPVETKTTPPVEHNPISQFIIEATTTHEGRNNNEVSNEKDYLEFRRNSGVGGEVNATTSTEADGEDEGPPNINGRGIETGGTESTMEHIDEPRERGGKETQGTEPPAEEESDDDDSVEAPGENGDEGANRESSGGPTKGDTVRFAEVTVVRTEIYKKPFLGGYKHKETGLEYHNASTQTTRPPTEREIKKSTMIKFHREAQTVDVAYKATQPKRESSTQMTKPGLYISEDTDKVLIPRRYFSAQEVHDLKIKKAIKIQCMVRSFFARRRVRRLREDKHAKQRSILEQQEAKRQEAAELRISEIERRRNPRTKEDFNILYQELEAWRKQETARIDSLDLSPEERKAVMYGLLQKETRLLQTIDKLKQAAGVVNKQIKIESTLDKMSKPKDWSALGGEANAIVETPFTKRAQELRDLYNGLKMPLLTIDQRLDVLLHVKWTIKEFECRLTRDLTELIDREADLLNRGRSEKSVEGLRQRILSLFLQFIETPEFNPEASRLKYVPTTSTVVK